MADNADQANKTFIVTGANTGIGLVTAQDLARRGARVLLACRSADKTMPIVEEIRRSTGNQNVEYVALDLGDLSSVRACAQALLDRDLPIHGLINNAGLAGKRGLTNDGFELTFGTNHLGPYLLTRMLLPRLIATAPSRIVNVASKAHYDAKHGIDFTKQRQSTAAITGLPEYAMSKLANVLFAKELTRRLTAAGHGNVTTYSLHPGVIASDVWRQVPAPVRWLMKRFMISVEEGAQTTLYCATEPSLANASGRYYDTSKEKEPSSFANDAQLAKELWIKSAEWVGLPAD